MKKSKIAIIGGGCLGLFLANLLQSDNLDIFIFEKNNKLGKKILASGNGKCNFTNISDFENKYNNIFANDIVNRYTVEKTMTQFKKIGLIYKNDSQGRCYPFSECSISVLDCLKANLKNMHILLETEVKTIIEKNEKYLIEYNDKKDYFDYVVCCSGSCASNLGSRKAYTYLNDLHLNFTEIKSSLAPVVVEENVSSLKGVRVKCPLTLVDEKGNEIYKENGEIMFKDDSLSGIAVFNASSFINRKKSKYKIILDLSAGMNFDELRDYIKSKKIQDDTVLKGFLNDKLAQYIFEKEKISGNLMDYQIEKVLKLITELTFNVKKMYPLEDAQVCSGGIDLCEVTPNLELKKYNNIYIGGELLDIDGISGGYNMQFAWSCAGVIAEEIKKKNG